LHYVLEATLAYLSYVHPHIFQWNEISLNFCMHSRCINASCFLDETCLRCFSGFSLIDRSLSLTLTLKSPRWCSLLLNQQTWHSWEFAANKRRLNDYLPNHIAFMDLRISDQFSIPRAFLASNKTVRRQIGPLSLSLLNPLEEHKTKWGIAHGRR